MMLNLFCEVKPGLSHYALGDSGKGAGASVEPLIEFAKDYFRDKVPHGWSEKTFFSSIPVSFQTISFHHTYTTS